MAAADALKKPVSAYWLWLGDNRENVQKMIGGKKVSDVAKKAGEMWKALSASAKSPYEKKAKEQKDAYDKFLATDEGQKALGEKKAAKNEAKAEKTQKEEARAEKQAAKEDKKNERACKAALKEMKNEKDDKLKKPQTAYWLWLADNREKIVKELGSSKPTDVAKKGGEMWKGLSDAARAPYDKKAKEQKDAYDKYVASEEGQAALKAFKDAQQATKDQFKRKVEEGEEEGEDAKVESPPAKKARGAGAPKVKSAQIGA